MAAEFQALEMIPAITAPQALLAACCEQFKLLKLQISLQLQGDCSLPAYKGSMWHGWLGHALKQVSEPAFKALYQQYDHEQPKPYAIEPGFDQKTEWRAGELIQFNLRLFGAASDLGPIVHNAILAGERLGLGPARTAVKLVAFSAISPQGLQAPYQACSLSTYLVEPFATTHAQTMLLNTPLRLKQQGKVLHNPQQLTAKLLAAQARRRLMQLYKYWVSEEPEQLETISQLPLDLGQSQLSNSLYFEDWQRFSLKQQEFIPLGGFKGAITINHCSPGLYQWLKIGEQLQLGGKTTFGLGIYQLVPAIYNS